MLNYVINFSGELQCRRVFRHFRKNIETHHKIDGKMVPEMIQNQAWGALWGEIFEILGGFYEFWACERFT